MLRILFLYIIPFVLPTFLYFLWLKRTGKKDMPWKALILAGAILLGIVAGGFTLWQGSPPDSSYTAPKLEDGHIIPASLNPQKE